MILPQPNLPIGSKPWADHITQETTAIDQNLDSLQSAQTALYREQGATVQLLSEQVQDLNTQVLKLPLIQSATVDVLGPGFVGNNTWQTLWTINIPFPANKTIADVMAFGLIRGGHPGASGVSMFFRVGINGVYGPEAPADSDFMGNVQYATQLTGGGTITITGQAMASGGSVADSRVSLNGLISFK